ncbi:hypothetical protein ERO13_A11G095900v2 [Gossypium hirsutum]|uniref:GIL1/IRKI C-terminal domain-containing protein n=4 Tax=Gossypium TaxID=3633 RepID=A0A5J5TQP9_GOSBA|nr:hypothetical protein ES319_A11G102700v1 [Gossypium barbadense]KAG4174027.1 hypothetical protein ERO13_A11G095900v2 [Gossypium hirsutum]TYG93433.1 hypothetical protein ES288_A11G109900v1 [Gossypium darwinii]TYI00074.1 hypothetical protein ES332_A11G108800v1 [Gossypium tomentosum]TYJ08938.1 hypothetical protein E1A91_A11G106400v1 [Gossypium mustelinum]
MESVVKNLIMDESDEKPDVGLMVMHGFWIGGSIIESRVYLSEMKELYHDMGAHCLLTKVPFSLCASTVLLGLIACKNAADSLCFCIGTLDYLRADVRKRLWL